MLFFLRKRYNFNVPLATKLQHLLMLTGSLIVAHIAAMMIFEGLNIIDAVWLTMTTITTVGYGDLSAKTIPGRASTIILLYLAGIFVLAQLVGVWVEYRVEQREKKAFGKWRWEMRDHIVIIGEATDAYVCSLVDQIRGNRAFTDTEIVWMNDRYTGTHFSQCLTDRHIAHVDGNPGSDTALTNACVADAKEVLILSDNDGTALDWLIRVRENSSTDIVVEVHDKKNNARFQRYGASQIIRSIRGYPEMAARAITNPGSEELIENLFTTEGDECVRYDVKGSGRWGDIVKKIMFENDIGTPVGYINGGKVITNPRINDIVDFDALFIVVGDDKQYVDINKIING